MCGITGGIWTNPERAIDRAVLQRMTDALQHRGPDDKGVYFSEFETRPPYESVPGVALGHRRLSIIDIEGGRQPMANEDQTVWIVFNGEIYNFAALRHRLEGAGHQLRTACDTEVIVHLYEDMGVDAFQHLNGMFAIAIWDATKRRLILARDRLGQKPLIYRVERDRLLFASELKSLLEVPDVPRVLDPGAVDEYLTYQYIPHPNTIFQGIRKLPPGHYAEFQEGKFDVVDYWSPALNREVRQTSEEYVEQLRELLLSSVELRMRSDVPLGAFLSGGIDSSLIVAIMQQQCTSKVKTFSIGFPIPEYDETHYARQVAEHLGTDHYEYSVTPDSVEVLPQLVWHFDEPFADSSAIPTWYLSQWTRQHVTVALSGDGGDELFAGYPRYRAARWGQFFDALPRPVRAALAARIWQSIPASARQKSYTRRFKRFASAIGSLPAQRYLEWIEIFRETQRAELYTNEFLEHLPASDPTRFLRLAWSRAEGRDAVASASLADLVTYLPCDLMTKVDVASMSHGLECRQPFLDYRLAELAIRMPTRLKYHGGRGKRILWQAFGHLLPPEIGSRPKMGFGVPLDHWFRNELRPMAHDVLLDQASKSRGLFQPKVVQRLIEQHATGMFDHSYRLWALLVFELWMRRWCG